MPKADGSGRVVATEVMTANDAISNMIREGKTHQIPSVIQSSAAVGMHTMESDLAGLVRAGQISKETAITNAPSGAELLRLL